MQRSGQRDRGFARKMQETGRRK